jgi:hypothetical protein
VDKESWELLEEIIESVALHRAIGITYDLRSASHAITKERARVKANSSGHVEGNPTVIVQTVMSTCGLHAPLVDDVHPGQDNATIMHVAMPWGVVPGCTHWGGDGIVVQRCVMPGWWCTSMPYLRELCLLSPLLVWILQCSANLCYAKLVVYTLARILHT